MFHRFKNLDKKQKLELYKVLGYSICALIGGAGSAKLIGVDADLGDIISVSYTHLTLPTTPYV